MGKNITIKLIFELWGVLFINASMELIRNRFLILFLLFRFIFKGRISSPKDIEKFS